MTASERDHRDEGAVLHMLLLEYPEQLTAAELLREMVGPNPGLQERDAVERAVRVLEHVGLIHRQGEVIWPSRAARYFYSLELD